LEDEDSGIRVDYSEIKMPVDDEHAQIAGLGFLGRVRAH